MKNLWLLLLNLYGMSVAVTVWINVFGQLMDEVKLKSSKQQVTEGMWIALSITMIPVVNIAFAIKQFRFLSNLGK